MSQSSDSPLLKKRALSAASQADGKRQLPAPGCSGASGYHSPPPRPPTPPSPWTTPPKDSWSPPRQQMPPEWPPSPVGPASPWSTPTAGSPIVDQRSPLYRTGLTPRRVLRSPLFPKSKDRRASSPVPQEEDSVICLGSPLPTLAGSPMTVSLSPLSPVAPRRPHRLILESCAPMCARRLFLEELELEEEATPFRLMSARLHRMEEKIDRLITLTDITSILQSRE